MATTGFSRGFLNAIGRERFEALIPNMPPTEGTLRHIAHDLRGGIRHLLPRVQAPSLVIGATQDITVPVEHSRALHTALPHSSYAEIDAGPVMFSEQEDTFVKLVTDFLES